MHILAIVWHPNTRWDALEDGATPQIVRRFTAYALIPRRSAETTHVAVARN